MNTEYAKFDEPRTEYNPPVTEPTHFSNIPDVLVPEDYVQHGVPPIEHEIDEVIRETVTPPATPPELEPGQAGCNVLRGGKSHYVDPIYKDDEQYTQKFMAKILIYNAIYFLPSFVLLVVACSWRVLDLILVQYAEVVYILVGVGVFLMLVFIYFVGLARNSPYNYIAYVCRIIITTLVFGVGCLMTHMWFLQHIARSSKHALHNHHNDAEALTEEGKQHEHEHHDNEDQEDEDEHGAKHLDETKPENWLKKVKGLTSFTPSYSAPYMGLLIISLFWFYMALFALLFSKFKFSSNDYRLPIIVFIIWFIISPALVTVVLNNGFGSKPISYDLLQIIIGCILVTLLGVAAPRHMDRLFEGQLCPLAKDETVYAALHFGL